MTNAFRLTQMYKKRVGCFIKKITTFNRQKSLYNRVFRCFIVHFRVTVIKRKILGLILKR